MKKIKIIKTKPTDNISIVKCLNFISLHKTTIGFDILNKIKS